MHIDNNILNLPQVEVDKIEKANKDFENKESLMKNIPVFFKMDEIRNKLLFHVIQAYSEGTAIYDIRIRSWGQIYSN